MAEFAHYHKQLIKIQVPTIFLVEAYLAIFGIMDGMVLDKAVPFLPFSFLVFDIEPAMDRCGAIFDKVGGQGFVKGVFLDQ
jgi:hypothetical protein